MIQQIQSQQLTQFVKKMNNTASNIARDTSTERKSPDSSDRLIRDMVDLIETPHQLEANIKVVQTYDEMLGEIVDLKS